MLGLKVYFYRGDIDKGEHGLHVSNVRFDYGRPGYNAFRSLDWAAVDRTTSLLPQLERMEIIINDDAKEDWVVGRVGENCSRTAEQGKLWLRYWEPKESSFKPLEL